MSQASAPTVTVKVDMRGAIQKTAVVRQIPAAFRRQANDWASQTVRYIKQSYKGGMVFARPPKELDLRLAQRTVVQGTEKADILIGTGREVGREEVVYARIQEEGGWVVPRKARALAIPLPAAGGRSTQMWRGRSFIVQGKEHALIATKTGKSGKLKPLFVLAGSVKLPARHWFSRPIGERMPELERMMSPEGVWARASAMAYKRTAAQGGKA